MSLSLALWLVNALWRPAESAVSALSWRLVMKLHSCPHPLCRAVNGVFTERLMVKPRGGAPACDSVPTRYQHTPLLMTSSRFNRRCCWDWTFLMIKPRPPMWGIYGSAFSPSMCRPACRILVCSYFVTQTWGMSDFWNLPAMSTSVGTH